MNNPFKAINTATSERHIKKKVEKKFRKRSSSKSKEKSYFYKSLHLILKSIINLISFICYNHLIDNQSEKLRKTDNLFIKNGER